MISYITGSVAGLGENYIVLDNGGIGYKVFMPAPAIYSLHTDTDIRVYTYMSVREDGISLFGFTKLPDLEMFRMLISVSGIGPKAALAILSSISTDELTMAVAAEDPKLIASAKGIGNKTAQKIIVELKGKISREALQGSAAKSEVRATAGNPAGSAQAEALDVLEALGFGRRESLDAISQVDGAENMDASHIVSAALKLID